MGFHTCCCEVCERSPYCGNDCGSCTQEDDLLRCLVCGIHEKDTRAKTLFGGLCENCDPGEPCGALIGPEGESCGVLGPCREHHGAGFCRPDKSGWKCDEHDLLPLYPDGRCKEGKRRIATIAKDWKAEVEDWKAEVEDWKAKRMRAKVDDFFCIGCGKAHGTLPCWIPFRSPDAFWLGAAALNGIIGMGIAIRSRVEMEVWGSFDVSRTSIERVKAKGIDRRERQRTYEEAQETHVCRSRGVLRLVLDFNCKACLVALHTGGFDDLLRDRLVWAREGQRIITEALLGSAEKTLTALNKINDIRNSIIGSQTFNWSEHAYPLVAALDEAGFKGMPFPEARENVGRLIERATRAEAEVERLREALAVGARAMRCCVCGKTTEEPFLKARCECGEQYNGPSLAAVLAALADSEKEET